MFKSKNFGLPFMSTYFITVWTWFNSVHSPNGCHNFPQILFDVKTNLAVTFFKYMLQPFDEDYCWTTNFQLVKRHAAEIFTSVILSTIFSLYSTALVGRLVGLEPGLTVSILPRCITVALALSIVSLFEGTSSYFGVVDKQISHLINMC